MFCVVFFWRSICRMHACLSLPGFTTIISGLGVIQFWKLTNRPPSIQSSWYPSLLQCWKTLYDASQRRKYFATDRESFWSIFVEYQEVTIAVIKYWKLHTKSCLYSQPCKIPRCKTIPTPVKWRQSNSCCNVENNHRPMDALKERRSGKHYHWQ